MRIYSRKEFLKLPEGTVFACGPQWAMDGFRIKGETWRDDEGENIDYLFHDLIQIEYSNSIDLADRFDDMIRDGCSYPINQSYQRDGTFDDDEVFLVFEKDDLKFIKSQIERLL
jgi:hypothetical protein